MIDCGSEEGIATCLRLALSDTYPVIYLKIMYLSEQGKGKRQEQNQAGVKSTSEWVFFVLMQ